MREILFRGKRIDNKAWEDGSLVITRGGCYDQQVFISDKMTGYHTPVIPETVCQFTGLTDKNGRKIFEGDIVKYSVNTVGIINYATACFCVHDIKNRNNPAMDIVFEAFPNGIEVIGNIYDNPELLEVKQND